MQHFKFDDDYRESDEYSQFFECLKAQGVDPMMWEYCIMLHKSNPMLYRTEKKKYKSEPSEKTPNSKLPKVFDSVDILPPEDIVLGNDIPKSPN